MDGNAISLRRRSQRGFSLIEMMVAVAIVCIIAAVAYPSFLSSIRKSRRSDAVGGLSKVQMLQERCRANQPQYCSSLTNDPTDATTPGLGLASTATANGYYTLSLNGVGATGYTAVATPVSGSSQASDGPCTRLRVTVNAGNISYGSATSSGSFVDGQTNPCWAQ